MTLADQVTSVATPSINLVDPHSLLAGLGAVGVFLVLFAETGLLIGFFLPGDSLLFTAGLLSATTAASSVHLSLPTVLLAAAGGATLGAQTGRLIGARLGPPLLQRRHQRLTAAAERARTALDRYGPRKAIVLAKFIPLVRTVINPLCGIVGIPPRTLLIWQVAGGALWTIELTLAGYLLGASIPNVDRYLLPIIAAIVALSLTPIAVEAVGRAASKGPGADTPVPEPRRCPGGCHAHEPDTRAAPARGRGDHPRTP